MLATMNAEKSDELAQIVASPLLLEQIIASWPNILDDTHLNPANVATLFSYMIGSPAYSGASRLLHDRLASTTIDRARRLVPYYSQLDQDASSCLDRVPTIDRAMVSAQREDFLAQDTQFAFATFTSGTTSGEPLIVERCLSEQSYLSVYFRELAGAPVTDGKAYALGLATDTNNHGSVLQIPARAYYFIIDLRERTGFHRAAWLLSQTFTFPGFDNLISRITSSFRKVFLLTQYLRERGIRLRPKQVQSISCYGNYIPRRQKKLIEEYYECEVSDVFSLSEFFGSARYCRHCSGFHFEPFVIVEVLEPDSDRHAPGYGELVVTPLFPFTQRFTLLRYRTGDYVEQIKCRNGEVGYRYKGRVRDCHRIEAPPIPWLSPIDVWEAVDEFPDLHRRSTPRFISLLDSSIGNMPDFRVVVEKDPPRLTIESRLTYDPSAYPERLQELSLAVRKSLLQCVPPQLNQWLNSDPKRLTITFVAPHREHRGVGAPE